MVRNSDENPAACPSGGISGGFHSGAGHEIIQQHVDFTNCNLDFLTISLHSLILNPTGQQISFAHHDRKLIVDRVHNFIGQHLPCSLRCQKEGEGVYEFLRKCIKSAQILFFVLKTKHDYQKLRYGKQWNVDLTSVFMHFGRDGVQAATNLNRAQVLQFRNIRQRTEPLFAITPGTTKHPRAHVNRACNP